MISISLWFGFIAFVVLALVLDLGVFNKKDHIVSTKESIFWTLIWTGMAIAFKFFLAANVGVEESDQFLAGYLLERILSIDNIFVFLLIFSYFKVPHHLQQRALVIGIIFAIVLRGIFITLGAELVQSFSWILYIFGAFLVYTGIKIILPHEEHDNLDNNAIVKFCKKHFGVASGYDGSHIFTMENGKKVLTMFGLTTIVLATSDVIFAVDSIPAIFSITQDTFIVFTANVFSVLGLRAVFFLIAGIIDKFYYLKYALSLILTFVGVKMLIVNSYHIDINHSLVFIVMTFVVAIIASVVRSNVMKK
jgi:tellurite resistance protein TerC